MAFRFGGKQQTAAFGVYRTRGVSLDKARALAAEAKALIARGINPNERKREQQAEQKATAATFDMIAKQWWETRRHLKHHTQCLL